ncbi:unnamed protein product [Closterium sp. NIES-64]|nr:unnamed protein product [Closterium sp. NIES-64]
MPVHAPLDPQLWCWTWQAVRELVESFVAASGMVLDVAGAVKELVVLDVAGAAKELVEKSLDAGATSVEVCLKKFGAELIEVADNGLWLMDRLDAGAMSMEVRLKDLGADLFKMADNGCGVTPPNWQAGRAGASVEVRLRGWGAELIKMADNGCGALTLKYHTSKIAHLADLQSLSSFGFRGEALSSLSTLADVTITTRTANEPIATRLAFDQAGKLLDAPREQVARVVGTTVSVAKIFSPLPVRRREFERNVRREFAKLSGRSSARITVVQTAGTGLMRENIIPVFGAKAAGGLDPVDITFPLSPAAITAAPLAPAAATGASSGRSLGDRQFFFLNGRPVDLPRLSKLLNELYRFFNSLQFPTAFLNVSLRADAYNVNVTPDKRKVFLHSEAALLSGLRAALSEFYSPNSEDRGGDMTCGGGTADRRLLSRGTVSGGEQARAWQGQRVVRGRVGGESSGGVERARGGADGRQAGLDAWLGKRVGGRRNGSGSRGGKMGGVDGGTRVRRRAGDGWLEEGGKELEGEVVEIEEDERGENAKENGREDMREEDEDSDEVREVEQEDGKAGNMQVQRSATEWKGAEKNDEERSGPALCAVDGGLQEATQDDWAGKNVLDLPLMTQEMTQADLPKLVGSQLLSGTQLAGQQEIYNNLCNPFPFFGIARLIPYPPPPMAHLHASAEKFNFERLKRSIVLNGQRLLM